MIWFYFAACSVIFFTALNLLQRMLAIESKNPRALALVFNTVAALIAFFTFILTSTTVDRRLPVNSVAWFVLITASLMYALFERRRFRTSQLLNASTFSIIANFSLFVALVGSLILYAESLTDLKIVGLVLILMALFLVSYTKTRDKASLQAVAYGIVTFLFLGIAWTLDKQGTVYFGAETYNILVWTVPIIFIYLPYVKVEDIIFESKNASWRIVVLAGLNVFGYLLQLKALEIHEASRVIPIVQTSTIFTVLAGTVFLKEREGVFRKVLAGILALVGVVLLS
jgi:uncharacterized membrane protein